MSAMAIVDWHWWFATDAGLLARIGIGAAIFAGLAIADGLRYGPAARRWREYLFLLAVVAAALVYGIVNDLLASGISPEYFVYGKGVSGLANIRWAACAVGLKASFSAGLIIGVALLIANNPRKTRRQLRYRELLPSLGMIALFAIAAATVGAAMGYVGGLNWTSRDLSAIWQGDLFRPRRFLCVYGMNLGGYAGAAIGTCAAVAAIVRRRKNSPRERAGY